MSEYLTVAELEKQTGISNASIRRYLGDFKAFFVPKGGSRIQKYEAGAVNILKRIKSLYDDGLDAHEIHNLLANEFPLVIDDEEPVKKEKTAEVPTLATSEEVAKIGEKVTAIEKKLEMQEQFNQALIQELQQQRLFFEKKFDEIIENQKVTSLREGMKQRKLEAVTDQEKQVTNNEQVTNSDEELTVTAGEEVATAKETSDEITMVNEEVTMVNEEVTNNDEELTVTNGEKAVTANEETAKASEEAVASNEEVVTVNEEVMNSDEEAMMNNSEKFPPRQEKQPKKKGFIKRWFGW